MIFIFQFCGIIEGDGMAGYKAPIGLIIAFSSVQSLSHVRLFATLMDCILPGSSLSMGFSKQESWSGLPFPSPEC